MGKCLVTVLKEICNNADLNKLGTCRITFGTTGTSRKMQIRFTENMQLNIVGGYFTDQTFTQNNGTTYNCTKDTLETLYVSSSNGYIIVGNKYKMSLLNILNSSFCIDVDDLKFTNDMKYLALGVSLSKGDLKSICTKYVENIDVHSTDVYGDISALGNCSSLQAISLYNNQNLYGDINVFLNTPKLENVVLGNDKIYGSIVSFGNCVKLSILNIPRTNLTGKVEDLANALIASGKTSGQITLTCDNTNITFNDQPCNYKIIKFTNSGVTYADS